MNYGTIAYNKVTDIEKYLHERSKIERDELKPNSVLFTLGGVKVILLKGLNQRRIFTIKPYKIGTINAVISFGATFSEPCVFNCDVKFNDKIVYSFVFDKDKNGDFTAKERYTYDYKFTFLPDDLSEINVSIDITTVYLNDRIAPPYLNIVDVELSGFINKVNLPSCIHYEEYGNKAVVMLQHFGSINQADFLTLPTDIKVKHFSELFTWFPTRRVALAWSGDVFPCLFRLNDLHELVYILYDNRKPNTPYYNEAEVGSFLFEKNVTDFDATGYHDGNIVSAFIAFIQNGKVYGSIFSKDNTHTIPFEIGFSGTGFFHVRTSKYSYGKLAIVAENADGTQIAFAPMNLIKHDNPVLEIKHYIVAGGWVK
ncbi:MAG: hypothetical protein RR334_02130 [Clostridia bacterium]